MMTTAQTTYTGRYLPPFTSLLPQPGGMLTGMMAHTMKDALTTLAHSTLPLTSTVVAVSITRRITREWTYASLSTTAAQSTPGSATAATMLIVVMSSRNVS